MTGWFAGWGEEDAAASAGHAEKMQSKGSGMFNLVRTGERADRVRTTRASSENAGGGGSKHGKSQIGVGKWAEYSPAGRPNMGRVKNRAMDNEVSG